MTKVISDASDANPVKVVVGKMVVLPLIIDMALIFARYGLVAALALALCVVTVTDFAAAFAMKGISMKAGVETLIIALFVLLGVKLVSLTMPY